MADEIRLPLPGEIRIGPAQSGRQERTAPAEPGAEPTRSFRELLEEQLAATAPDVRFSAHAQARLESRGIELTESDLTRIREALDRAEAKGAKESLVVMDDLALVVSVPNRTVITAIDGPSRRGNVFTNIDSAVIV